MNPNEMAQYKVMAEQLRRARRGIDVLKAQNEALRRECDSLKQERHLADAAFAEEDTAFFQMVHSNHRARAPRREVVSVG